MNFFVNKAMGHGNSGVEHAQFFRAKMFRERKIPFKFIFTDLLPDLHENMAEWKIKENEVINLFEFLLSDNPEKYLNNGITEFESPERNTLWDLTDTLRIEKFKTISGITIKTLKKKIFSKKENIYLVSDDRFFLSRGKHSITWYLSANEGTENQMKNFHIQNFNGKDYFFETFEMLLNFFYTYLNYNFKKNNFIIDRGSENEEVLINLKRNNYEMKIIDIVHAAHLVYFKDGFPLWNNYYQYMFDHIEYFEKIIVATEIQREQMIADLGRGGSISENKIMRIPVGGVEKIMSPRKLEQGSIRFLTASRLHPEKNIIHIVKAIALLRQRGINATLDIWGAGSDNVRIEKTISELKLDKYVILKGLSQDMLNVMSKYDIFVSASYSEGFGLTYIEAIGNALPIASYNNLFGAQELIKDGLNGYLAEFDSDPDSEDNNIKNLSIVMEKTYKNYDELSVGANKVAEMFSVEKISNLWMELIEELK